jgi:hypothetical protein
MARDRFVYWGKERPTKEQAEDVIKNYFHDAYQRIEWKRGRFFVDLVGTHSHPLKDVLPVHPGQLEGQFGERWIEVYLDEGYLDVITRQQDAFTENCADGLARVLALAWDGRLEDT